MKKIKRLAIYVLILLFGVIYSLIAITKYQHYQTGLDIAIYIQSMWFYTHFSLPFVTLYPTFGDLVWADHFSPSLVLLTPFYFIWKDPRMLLILQSFALVFGAYPIYHFAKEKLKNNFLALSFAFAFLTFFGVQHPLTFDFHLATMAASFMPWILWAMFKKKWKLFVVLCVIASGFKEDMPLYISTLSVYLILSRRNWKLGIFMLPIFFGYAYLVTKHIMPSLAHNAVKVFSLSYFNLQPDYLWSVFFNSPIKISTMFLSLAHFLFLPLFSGLFLLLPIAHFFISFSNPDFPGRWDIYLHYRSYIAGIVAFGAILGFVSIGQKVKVFASNKIKIAVGVFLVVVALFFDYKLHLPLNTLLKPQFYYTESWIYDNDEVAKKVPDDAYLLTTNHLAPQVSFRKQIFYFPHNIGKTDYVFLDIRRNQPIINYWLTAKNEEGYQELVRDVLTREDFTIVYKSGDAVLLKRLK